MKNRKKKIRNNKSEYENKYIEYEIQKRNLTRNKPDESEVKKLVKDLNL